MFAVQVSHKMIVMSSFLNQSWTVLRMTFNFCAKASLVMAADFMASRIKFVSSLRVNIRLISLDRRKISTFLAGVIPDSFAVRF